MKPFLEAEAEAKTAKRGMWSQEKSMSAQKSGEKQTARISPQHEYVITFFILLHRTFFTASGRFRVVFYREDHE